MELGNIKTVSIVDQMTSAYLDYSMSVIVSRALPDVRDGLKPVHRRVLYAMDQMGLQSTKAFRKCAGVVGEVLKSYHPHGDVAVYDSLVRMAQPWSMRYPLVMGQGNFGSQDDDPPAAMRYTESKMSAITDELLRDIEKDTVDFGPNYDNQTMEPSVLPARLPNLLLNGSTGIAVGMATNIPPHNLNEVCDGITYLINNPEATTEDLSRIVRGPDFPTGGIIRGREGIRNTYANGRGRIVVKARTKIEEHDRGRSSIIVTELPYQVNKADLVKKIAEMVRDKRIDGISEVRDESDRQGMRILIELKRDANPDSVLNMLFKYTAMQSAFNSNMLALVDRQPRILTLKAFLQHYINHREIVITRRIRYDLAKAEARKHILDGLKIAMDHLDAVIKIIRESQSSDVAKTNLQAQFGLSNEQARAILDMRLGQLAALERQRVENELAEILKSITYFQKLLSDINEVRELIKADLKELKEKYGDERRSTIEEAEAGDFKMEDLIPNDEVVVTLTENGYIKRLPSNTYRAQRRGGRGITGMVTREDDAVRQLLVVHAHDSLLFFTDRGRVFQMRVYEVPDTSRTARGEHIINLIAIEQRERVTAVVFVPKGVSHDYMIVATKKGEVKKTSMEEFEVVRRQGLIAMNLEEDDELVGARLAHEGDHILMITAQGKA
ncbi:MAG TPA: DNA gyrase subunit A, partial [Ktedonobacteraceae bacterium]|nr:DNA gyrase subunit A [Ktedonobacteraceae bacterium]